MRILMSCTKEQKTKLTLMDACNTDSLQLGSLHRKLHLKQKHIYQRSININLTRDSGITNVSRTRYFLLSNSYNVKESYTGRLCYNYCNYVCSKLTLYSYIPHKLRS